MICASVRLRDRTRTYTNTLTVYRKRRYVVNCFCGFLPCRKYTPKPMAFGVYQAVKEARNRQNHTTDSCRLLFINCFSISGFFELFQSKELAYARILTYCATLTLMSLKSQRLLRLILLKSIFMMRNYCGLFPIIAVAGQSFARTNARRTTANCSRVQSPFGMTLPALPAISPSATAHLTASFAQPETEP